MTPETTRKKEKKKRNTKQATLLVFVFLIFCGGFLFLAYRDGSEDALTIALRNKLPLPAVIVGTSAVVTYPEIMEQVRAIRRFYETQDFASLGVRVDLTTATGKKRLKLRERELVNKLIEGRVMQQLAEERGIIVSDELVHQGVERKLAEYGSRESVENELRRLYGWTLVEFEEKIVRPSLYEEKLTAVFEREIDAVSAGEARINKAKEALQNGVLFEEAARQHSEGRTAADGGDLGWFAVSDLDPDLREPVVQLPAGATSDIITSRLGFHIIRVHETRKENGATYYHLSQIFARRVTFADWLTERIRERQVTVLMPEYVWDHERAMLEFRDPSLRAFEEEVLRETGGEAVFAL